MNLKRGLAMVLVAASGSVSLAFGLHRHSFTFEETKEKSVSIAVPDAPSFGQTPFGSPRSGDVPSGMGQGNAPLGLKYVTAKEKYTELSQQPESVVVREVTYGGVVRLGNGHLKRTYSGKPPTLCPT